ncbi:multicopper oxidase domain-containing protein [Terrimonas alba]|uniref:multicopper oxidase domain-containing protein n=1 Tax=Terrimonas alba TaxID=3349636 RepID=UPI0035F453AF
MEKFFTIHSKRWLGPMIFLSSLTLPASAQTTLDPKTQSQFVNPLPVPSVIDGRNGGLFTIGISQFDQWLGLVDPATQQPMQTKVWGYNGSYPGPTILAKKNTPIEIFWRNNLVNGSNQPLPHLLPLDPTLHWALSGITNWQQSGIPVVTHLHGGQTESASDGLPDAWFTPNFALKGPGFIKGDLTPYYYGNTQEAATLWYHDHALGITRLNVYAGLAGYYLLTDNNEMNLQNTAKLPASPFDLGLVIQDRMFTTNGQLYYPSMPEEAEQPNPSILPEFFGDFILVNGKTWPILEVEPRQYRFRVLNGSDSRFYNLFLSSGLVIQQIATDNGLLPSPVPLTQMLIAPGERKDIILDFSHPSLWGQTIIVRNNAKTPFPKGSAVNPQTTGRIMAFSVTKPLNPDYPLTSVPATLRPPIVPLETTLPARKLILFEAEDEYDRLKPMLGTVEDGVLEWHDPITENPMLNSTEIWEIYNETEDAHPIHLHGVTMQLINRQKFSASVDEENGKPTDIRLIGQPNSPGLDEQGWKDTWVTFPGEVTRVITKFDIEGLYAWHCHILSHEDHEMMRSYYVGEMNLSERRNNEVKNAEPAFEMQAQLQTLPNPFNSQFKVRFNLVQPSVVSINMYDAKGSLVKKVQNGTMSQGLQQVNIDGGNWANGIYYCEVTINNQRMIRKMILQNY